MLCVFSYELRNAHVFASVYKRFNNMVLATEIAKDSRVPVLIVAVRVRPTQLTDGVYHSHVHLQHLLSFGMG